MIQGKLFKKLLIFIKINTKHFLEWRWWFILNKYTEHYPEILQLNSITSDRESPFLFHCFGCFQTLLMSSDGLP